MFSKIIGLCLNEGVGSGLTFKPRIISKVETDIDADKELSQYIKAIDTIKSNIANSNEYQSGDQESKDILMVLENEALTADIKKLIKSQKQSASQATKYVADKFFKAFNIIDTKESKKFADEVSFAASLIISELSDLQAGVSSSLTSNDLVLLIEDMKFENLELIKNKKVNAIILKENVDNEDLLKEIHKIKKPFVVLGKKFIYVQENTNVAVVDGSVAL
ncbi:hypothetical protein ESOMN_v1c06220 [Williamsoniiplasma somnilux]|uniref:Phosphotransferase system enzyme I N-terminal domain-containing protein n=1 Tax=Williamsoniiplasma somnilux TaxID=215578 RepID=A0A2K8NZ45_9MOLU|nr:phosphoenolpyruvate-utilizing N-terminal domain-containing protein [Williamsoniiplasma somnilux]ATZ19004.1 hypothetical protein ESOMN_v1c06220 [Williamsoniiplasma somnilux]